MIREIALSNKILIAFYTVYDVVDQALSNPSIEHDVCRYSIPAQHFE